MRLKHDTNVLALLPGAGAHADAIARALTARGREGLVERVSTVEGLGDRLRALRLKPDLVIVHVDGAETLRRMLHIRELMAHQRLVLVLSEGDVETVNHCHTLRPRVVLYTEAASEELAFLMDRVVAAGEARSAGAATPGRRSSARRAAGRRAE